MADFAITVTAAEPALGWEPGSFLSIYGQNRETAVESILEGKPLVVALRQLLAKQGPVWTGTAAELREALLCFVEEEDRKWFPRSAKSMGNKLREVAPGLRSTKEITTRFYKDHGTRRIELAVVGELKLTETQIEGGGDDDLPF